jgi:hypothetical protein
MAFFQAEQAVLPRFVQLPRSSTRLEKRWAHLKLITAIRPIEASCAFEGKIYPPGGLIPIEAMGERPVLLECAGPVGRGRRGRLRELLWILWEYDWESEEWRELARAQARDSSWAMALREPALRAMQKERAELVDLIDRGQKLAAEIMESIDIRIEPERESVRAGALNSVYDQVAGRLAQLVA